MGREIRRVPPDWEHPRSSSYGHEESYQPLFDRTYREAAEEWIAKFTAWIEAGRPELMEGCPYFWDYEGGPPDEAYHRTREWTPEQATAYQVYETVTEGTPISPVCATRDDVMEWVVLNMNVSPAAAERFLEMGSVPSMMVTHGPEGAVIRQNVEMLEE
jgi:hypothetical protein